MNRKIVFLLVFGWMGCGEKEADDTAVGFCADAPLVTYESFGAGFFTQECESCHASTSPNRLGAPESVTFDTEEEILALKDRVLERATGDSATMPPQGGVPDEDREKLEFWLRCW